VYLFISLAAWTSGIIGLLVCLPILLVIATFSSPDRLSDRIRPLMRVILAFFFVRVRVTGLDKVDKTKAHVFMANHASFFDLFILAAYLPGKHRGMEAAEHFSWPIWGRFLRRVEMVPVDRSSAAASMRSMREAAKKVREGASILVLPEGTRTRTGRMLPFNRLPFYVPREAWCDIVPVGLKGTFWIKNKNGWLLSPGRAEMVFGEPVDAKTVRTTDMKELVQMVRDRIAALCGET